MVLVLEGKDQERLFATLTETTKKEIYSCREESHETIRKATRRCANARVVKRKET